MKRKVLIKGAGSENKSKLEMMLPTSSEEEIVNNVKGIVRKLIEQERKAREYLNGKGIEFEDKVYRAYGSLMYAKKLSYSECTKLISKYGSGHRMCIIYR